MSPGADRDAGAEVSEQQFRALHQRLREANGSGTDDRRGALNHLSRARVLAAIGEVRTGRTVSLAAPVETWVSPDNPEPARHEMTEPTQAPAGAGASGLRFALDRIAMNVHGNADSHIDALSHVIYDDTLYNDVPADALTGAAALSIDVDHDGIVGRGVLLDIPRARGVRWLEPGDHVTAGDLAAAERAQNMAVEEGDLLFVRVGHRARRIACGSWNAAEHRVGLHPTALEFLSDRRVAVLGGDGNNDTAPSTTEGVDFPVHALAVHAMGLQLLDYLQFEELRPICAERGRWSFLAVIAPLRLPDGTGSPVNPIAIL